MKLVDDAGSRWKHYSTQALTLGVSIQGTWAVFPEDLKAGLGPDIVPWVSRVTAFVLLLGLIGKFVDQTPKG